MYKKTCNGRFWENIAQKRIENVISCKMGCIEGLAVDNDNCRHAKIISGGIYFDKRICKIKFGHSDRSGVVCRLMRMQKS